MPVPFPVFKDGRIEVEPHLTVLELAELLRTTREAVYKRTAAHEWPYIRIVRNVYFSPDHVRQILELGTHERHEPEPSP